MEAIAALHVKLQQVTQELDEAQDRVQLTEDKLKSQRSNLLVGQQEIKTRRELIDEVLFKLQTVNNQLAELHSKNTALVKHRDDLLVRQEMLPALLCQVTGDFVEKSNAMIQKVERKIDRCISESFWIDCADKLHRETCRRQSFRQKMRDQQAKNLAEEESLLMNRLREEEANTLFLKSCSDILQTKLDDGKANPQQHFPGNVAQKSPATNADNAYQRPNTATANRSTGYPAAAHQQARSGSSLLAAAPKINFRKAGSGPSNGTAVIEPPTEAPQIPRRAPMAHEYRQNHYVEVIEVSSVCSQKVATTTAGAGIGAAARPFGVNNYLHPQNNQKSPAQVTQLPSQQSQHTPWYQQHRKRGHPEVMMEGVSNSLSKKSMVAALLETGIEILNDFTAGEDDMSCDLYDN